jgi:hypothetical protein
LSCAFFVRRSAIDEFGDSVLWRRCSSGKNAFTMDAERPEYMACGWGPHLPFIDNIGEKLGASLHSYQQETCQQWAFDY